MKAFIEESKESTQSRAEKGGLNAETRQLRIVTFSCNE